MFWCQFYSNIQFVIPLHFVLKPVRCLSPCHALCFRSKWHPLMTLWHQKTSVQARKQYLTQDREGFMVGKIDFGGIWTTAMSSNLADTRPSWVSACLRDRVLQLLTTIPTAANKCHHLTQTQIGQFTPFFSDLKASKFPDSFITVYSG